MFIRIWYPYIILSCIVVPSLVAKPFSLNKAIAAEERQKQSLQTTFQPKLSSEYPEKILLNKATRLYPSKLKKLKATDNKFPLSKNLFPSLKYRKTFQIRSPLKPKKVKYIQKARNKRKNQNIRRHVYNDEKNLRKYVPLLKSLSLLFDNILDGDSIDSHESRREKYRKYRNTSNRNKTNCTCTGKPDGESQKSTEEAIIFTTPFVAITTITESVTAETPATTTYNTPAGDIGGLRPNTDVSLLSAGNTISGGGNDTGLRERSSSPFYTSLEGNITGNYRDSEHNPGSGEDVPGTENYEENTDSNSRNGASSDELGRGGGLRGDRNEAPSPVYRGRTVDEAFENPPADSEDSTAGVDRGNLDDYKRENKLQKSEDGSRYSGGNFNELERQNNLEARRNETEGSTFLQQFVRGQPKFISDDYVDNNTQSIQPKESDEESYNNVTFNIADDQRFFVGNSAFTTEVQKASPKNAAVISISDLNNPRIMLQNSAKHKAPYVTIIDGYSVARDKNGANKLAEQSIRFHS